MNPPIPPEPDPPEPGPDPPGPDPPTPTYDYQVYDENSLTDLRDSSGNVMVRFRCYGYVKVGDDYYFPKLTYEFYDGDDWVETTTTGYVFIADGTTSGYMAWGNYMELSGNHYSNINKYLGVINQQYSRNASVTWCERYTQTPAPDQTVFSKIGGATSCTYEVI